VNSLFISYFPQSINIIDEQGEINQIHKSDDDTFIKAMKEIANEFEFITDSKHIFRMLANEGIKCSIDINHPTLTSWRKNRYENLMEKTDSISDYEGYISSVRNQALLETREKIKATAGKRDELAAQIVHAIDDIQKSYNLTVNRLSELYSLHFPELVDNISNYTTMARIISEKPMRTEITAEYLEGFGIPEEKLSFIIESINDSLGGEFTEEDLKPIQFYAHAILTLDKQLKELEKWIDAEMKIIAPNLTAVAGANVGARLISSMGSLRQLAMKPSSKIQTIGAERALYAALRGKGTPPKHGIIFQVPEIGNAPYWIRGKVARSYAGKIAIAARLDEFGGEMLGEKMRAELRKNEAKLRELNPEPPKKKPSQKFSKAHPAVKRKRRRSKK
jgi:nucleolar protein 56